MALQCGKGGVKGHITLSCPHKAVFSRVVRESKGISGVVRRKETSC